LQDSEIKIYMHLVANNELTAYKIAKETGIHRSTTYDILERLVIKGFVSKIEREGTAYYAANEISRILTNLKDKENILLSLTPELKKMMSYAEPKVRVLEGAEGQKQAVMELFNGILDGSVKSVNIIGNGPGSTKSLNLFIKRIINETKEKKLVKKVKYRGIWNPQFKKSEFEKDFETIGENRVLDNIPSRNTTMIFGDTVAFSYTTNQSRIIEIIDKVIADEFRSYFEHLWKISK